MKEKLFLFLCILVVVSIVSLAAHIMGPHDVKLEWSGRSVITIMLFLLSSGVYLYFSSNKKIKKRPTVFSIFWYIFLVLFIVTLIVYIPSFVLLIFGT
jgi:hypothetical protein